jgi:hypothetical protein
VADATDTEHREAARPEARSIRPVIEHALTVYYDGNAELACALSDRLLSEDRSQR